jgi:hypothetical protein
MDNLVFSEDCFMTFCLLLARIRTYQANVTRKGFLYGPAHNTELTIVEKKTGAFRIERNSACSSNIINTFIKEPLH